ncbi:WD40 repeat-like protein [Conidiobolus coronatus NRRL 28638]|uniref:WD40 repeat-like protein n=1 Tax=Conidiobolus coronatus (strain ATCC 28846 / CBS 209.66 / NRRL 28638) TaxID=796925 RepID=A0A137PI36_CONC2|nr:WD40 repeat-like protein [Conidiobolus coronatus NRRL 28638]|eukprot:KXN74662.1 WD40 repeat-like protein [Conidiobolus coronatus NRRL 28638]
MTYLNNTTSEAQHNNAQLKLNDFSKYSEDIVHGNMDFYRNWVNQVPFNYKYIHTLKLDENDQKISNPNVFFLPYLGEEVDGSGDTFNIPLMINYNISNAGSAWQSKSDYTLVPFQTINGSVAAESINKFKKIGLKGMQRDQPFYHRCSTSLAAECRNTVIDHDQAMSVYSNNLVRVSKISSDFYQTESTPEILNCSNFTPSKAIAISDNRRAVAGRDGHLALFDSSSPANDNTYNPILLNKIRIPYDNVDFKKAFEVTDLKFSKVSKNLLYGVTSSSQLFLWDSRDASLKISPDMHDGPINSIDSHIFDDNYLLTGGSDRVVKVWDRRKLSSNYSQSSYPSIIVQKHHSQVNQVSWSPMLSDAFASCSDDGTVNIYTADSNFMTKDKIFTHYGHQSPVKSFQWFPLKEGLLSIASISQMNDGTDAILQVWETEPSCFNNLN